ncbi:6-phosphogluconolactonase [Pseudooceanicola nanhaiensis]|uniref:6-phosphogluconolactonase n=1 Tax=Pseudooceanicola nanhaiensis TaxID=375761 RepID=UPI001CD73799|nr:6-phosphogluconolactonase [Pseudooceanicola nanhaiensis]MCA0921601.1 6-phosphogluconolactonase [Pseudooceanicola nanhaiensis]
MKLHEYPDRDLLALTLADAIASELTAALRHEERVTLAVPGGTSPGPVFDALCDVALDWSRVDVVLSDERWVPVESPRSNTKLVRERLLVNRAAAATLLPLYQPVDTPEEALEALAASLKPHLPLTVLLLGMGADMHTASLFPGADRLEEGLSTKAPLLLPMRAEGAGEPRITMTAPVLQGAMSTHLLIMGAEKKAAMEAARKLPTFKAPVAAILDGAQVHYAD